MQAINQEVKDVIPEPTTNKFQCQNPNCRKIFFGNGGVCPQCNSSQTAMVIES